MDSGATEKVAKFIAGVTFEAIPPEAVAKAKNAILDCIGVTLAGSAEGVVKIVAEQVRRYGAAGEAGVIGRGFRTAAEWAAWINGTASHALDYDDAFSDAARFNFHPTASILAGIMALGQKLEVPGKELIAAYVVGIEVESRLGAALGSTISRAGWHSTPVVGTIGAAAACARVLKLESGQVRMALGIAGSFAGGLLQNFGTNTKPLHAGNASRNGVVSALLAQGGFTAHDSILEGEAGFCAMVSDKKVTTMSPYDEDLGINWRIVFPGLAAKAYPCCRSTHPAIDASLHLRDVIGKNTDQVVRIVCKTSRHHTTLARFRQPKSPYEAKFSIPYCIAVALVRGRIILEDFTHEKLASPEVQRLLSKVDFEYPEELAKDPMGLTQEVVITLADGKEYSSRIEAPKGEPENPMTHEELSTKFADCGRVIFSQSDIERLLQTIGSLESLDTVSPLMDTLTYPAKDQKG